MFPGSAIQFNTCLAGTDLESREPAPNFFLLLLLFFSEKVNTSMPTFFLSTQRDIAEEWILFSISVS